MTVRMITTPDGRRVPDPRGQRAWKVLSKQVAREEPICWLGFEGCTVKSTTGDHVIPVSVRPDLALVRSNVRGACSSCNYKRGNLPIDALNLQREEQPRPPALGVFD